MPVIDSFCAETEQRFRDREMLRREHVDRLAGGETPLTVDAPDRAASRLARLGFFKAARKVGTGESPVPEPADVRLHDETARVALERILGTNDLVGVSFLENGLRVARTVGRVRIREEGRLRGYGTGFLVSPRLLLTNHHVLPSSELAQESAVEFDFQEGAGGGMLHSSLFELEPGRFFISDAPLDFTVVAVREVGGNGMHLSMFGWNRLIEETGKILIGEFVNIVHHPNGDPKQLSLRENRLVDLLDYHLHYQADTAPGSSGSPVFNDQWEVVALHRSGVPRRNADGQILTRDGSVYEDGVSEDQIAWVANEGVRISKIVQLIKGVKLDGEAKRLCGEMFEADAPIAKRGDDAIANLVSPLRATGSGEGTYLVTIPLQVTIAVDNSTGISSVSGRSSNQPAAPVSREASKALLEYRAARSIPYYAEEEDERLRQRYYAGIDLQGSPAAMFAALSELLAVSHEKKLSYKPARFLYPWVDLFPDLRLRSVYTGEDYDPEQIIREAFDIEAERELFLEVAGRHDGPGAGSLPRTLGELAELEAALPYNCEHAVPQSWFGGKEPMRGDLHHLFTCEKDCNSFRGNTPYFDFPDYLEVVRESCGKREANKFEPYRGKGQVARAVLYFLLRYPGEVDGIARELDRDRLPVLLDWHQMFPVTPYERHRNLAIHKKQGNRNPLIDYPEWADSIDFSRGLG